MDQVLTNLLLYFQEVTNHIFIVIDIYHTHNRWKFEKKNFQPYECILKIFFLCNVLVNFIYSLLI